MVSDVKAKRRTGLFFPDEIVLDIVSRLPAKDALRCRHVCRRWWYLTSTRDFFDLHLRRQGIVPLILVENIDDNWRFDHFLMDKWWEPTRTISRVQNFPICTEYLVQFSHNGLVVLKQTPSSGNYVILNPINGENVKISLSREMSGSEIYGVFFHPSLKEYCTLWLTKPPERRGNHSQYKLLNLGPNPSWRNIKSLVGHKSRIGCTRPVFVDKYIYWMVEAGKYDKHKENHRYNIMEFDVNREELTLMRPPVECNNYERKLLNIDGVLSMVVISPRSQLLLVRIWTLRYRSEQLWIESEFRINNDIYRPTPRTINPIAVVDAELVFLSQEMIFVCNLKAGTIRNFGEKLDSFAKVFPHVMTLASLKDCKSEFCMGDKGEEECGAEWFLLPRREISGSKCSVGQDAACQEESSTSNSKASENAVATG